MDDLPPPPYTETDINSHVAQSASNDDDASTVSSSQGPIIYTPPESPRESHFDFSGNEDHRTVASVQSYFESHPAITHGPEPNKVVLLDIRDDGSSSPSDFPYPSWIGEYDTTEQDWHTFLNYAIPNRIPRADLLAIERKLKAKDDGQSPTAEKDITEAQLGQTKTSTNLPSEPSHSVDAMIREWNNGFFGPRGLTVRRPDSSSNGLDTSFGRSQTTLPQPEPLRQEPGSSMPQEQHHRSGWNPFRPFQSTARGLRIGRLNIEDDRVSFGNSFEVNRNGVRWNNQPNNDNHCPFPDPRTRSDPFTVPSTFPGSHRGRASFGDRDRGSMGWGSGSRPMHQHPYGSRNRSPSSHSDASSSDASSDSSIGSLPDWDDLKDSQLSATKESVSAWLTHPELPVTKSMIKAARSEIKAAKNAPPTLQADPITWEIKKQVLRQEVRALLAQFKELKREQKKSAKLARKDRRQLKRALKRERRDKRRAERREHKTQGRDMRRAEREAERGARRGGLGPLGHNTIIPGPIVASPPVPISSLPPISNLPSMPGGASLEHRDTQRGDGTTHSSVDHDMESKLLAQQSRKQHMMAKDNMPPWLGNEDDSVFITNTQQDYQAQLMQLEMENKKRLLIARAEQDRQALENMPGESSSAQNVPASTDGPWASQINHARLHAMQAQHQANLARCQAARIRSDSQQQINIARAQAIQARTQAQHQANLALSQAARTRSDSQQQMNTARARAIQARVHAQQQANLALSQAQHQASRSHEDALRRELARMKAMSNHGANQPSGATQNPVSGPSNGTGNKHAALNLLKNQISSKEQALLVLRTSQMNLGQTVDSQSAETKAFGRKMRELECEILDLTARMQRLSVEADEQLAAELEEEEKRLRE
ncbi:uncharacterized protein GGS25DRAFT_498041 [Hypoxylon fragiforme]|uniref:uncharacterized protein n=1 Tax=Hypoxylon fragiforme TaxID=63214 RepID=UPI0020C70477|nr:uncharacterized protein GGS25DRAFT_498041 [Hypoxylon fragiforme]KAI2605773.1 hypothetical protein GGS25DRAFT_498041 [Hypoxylon fragiforme]